MNDKLVVLLIEDDLSACEAIQNYINSIHDVTLVGVSNNSEKALVLTKAHLPDVVILDLELHQGGGNGLLYLSALNKLSLPKRPFILVTTNNTSEVTLAYARQLGADFIMTKYNSDYSAKSVIDFLRSMKSVIASHTSNFNVPMPNMTPAQKEKLLEQRIQRELDLLGISPKVKGYRYLIEAIQFNIDTPSESISRHLADKYKKSTASVERAMQNAISNAWATSDPEELAVHYRARIRAEKGMPTLMEFISYYAREIKNGCGTE